MRSKEHKFKQTRLLNGLEWAGFEVSVEHEFGQYIYDVYATDGAVDIVVEVGGLNGGAERVADILEQHDVFMWAKRSGSCMVVLGQRDERVEKVIWNLTRKLGWRVDYHVTDQPDL